MPDVETSSAERGSKYERLHRVPFQHSTGRSVEANGVKPPGGAEHVHVYLNQIGSKQGFLHLTLEDVQSDKQGIGARTALTAGGASV